MVNGSISSDDLGEKILCQLDLKDVVEIIHQDREISERFNGHGFEGGIWYFAEKYEKDEKISPDVGAKCKGCEYRSSEEGKKCGFNECWTQAVGLTEEELKKENVTIVDEIAEYDYGKFVHILDPEGNIIELWEPKD